MSGFFWNIRGFNKSNKQQVIKDWIQNNNLEFGGLIETRVKESKAIGIAGSTFPDWSMVSNYEFNRLGRIWVVWSKKVSVNVVYKSGQLITCAIKVDGAPDEFLCSFIYASNFEEERKELWRDLNDHKHSPLFHGKAWLCCGDFNEILDIEEHSNHDDSPSVTSGMRDFQDTIRHCSLMDMAMHGPQYTWCNKRETGLICKKLDRALINDSWLQMFPNSYCVFDAGGCSDHLRGKINVSGSLSRPKSPFRFTNVIASMPDFIPLVESFWVSTEPLFHSTSALFRFSKKLKQLKPLLRQLSRRKLSDLSTRASDAYSELCTLQQATLTSADPQTVLEEATAYDRWEKLSSLEECYLKQKSNLHWLRVGDKNNRFFHNTVKERLAKNSIKEIVNPDGARLTSKEDVKGEAVRFFTSLLTSTPADYTGMTVMERKQR